MYQGCPGKRAIEWLFVFVLYRTSMTVTQTLLTVVVHQQVLQRLVHQTAAVLRVVPQHPAAHLRLTVQESSKNSIVLWLCLWSFALMGGFCLHRDFWYRYFQCFFITSFFWSYTTQTWPGLSPETERTFEDNWERFLHRLTGQMPFLSPIQQCQSTEGFRRNH